MKMLNRVYALDKHGSHWYWNCGWKCIENKSLCFSHSLWRKSIKPNIVSYTSVLNPKPRNTNKNFHPRTRPYESWYRADVKVYDHSLYGEVMLKETDSNYAVVRGENDVPVIVRAINLTWKPPKKKKVKKISKPKPLKSKWGELAPFILIAKSICKDKGLSNPTNEQLKTLATRFKDSQENLFKLPC